MWDTLDLGSCIRTISWDAENPPSPLWPSGLKRWNRTLVPVVRAWFEPRCGRPRFAPTRSGVRVCGRNRTEVRERECAEGTGPCCAIGWWGQGQHNKLCLVKALIPRIHLSKHWTKFKKHPGYCQTVLSSDPVFFGHSHVCHQGPSAN